MNRYWRYEWLRDGFTDLVYALDLFFTMLIMCPSAESNKFRYDPHLDLEEYEEEREREHSEQAIEMHNMSINTHDL